MNLFGKVMFFIVVLSAVEKHLYSSALRDEYSTDMQAVRAKLEESKAEGRSNVLLLGITPLEFGHFDFSALGLVNVFYLDKSCYTYRSFNASGECVLNEQKLDEDLRNGSFILSDLNDREKRSALVEIFRDSLDYVMPDANVMGYITVNQGFFSDMVSMLKPGVGQFFIGDHIGESIVYSERLPGRNLVLSIVGSNDRSIVLEKFVNGDYFYKEPQALTYSVILLVKVSIKQAASTRQLTVGDFLDDIEEDLLRQGTKESHINYAQDWFNVHIGSPVSVRYPEWEINPFEGNMNFSGNKTNFIITRLSEGFEKPMPAMRPFYNESLPEINADEEYRKGVEYESQYNEDRDPLSMERAIIHYRNAYDFVFSKSPLFNIRRSEETFIGTAKAAFALGRLFDSGKGVVANSGLAQYFYFYSSSKEEHQSDDGKFLSVLNEERLYRQSRKVIHIGNVRNLCQRLTNHYVALKILERIYKDGEGVDANIGKANEYGDKAKMHKASFYMGLYDIYESDDITFNEKISEIGRMLDLKRLGLM